MDTEMETRTYTLKDISLNICDGVHNTVIDDENGDCLLLSAKNIQDGRIVFDEASDRKINRELCNKLKKRTQLEKNDIAITTVGANVGDLAIVGDGSENYEFQRSVGLIKTNSKIANSGFLFYLLGTKSFNYYFHVIATGSAQPCLFLGTLNKVKVQLPPLPIQQKIASILSTYDNLIQNYKKQIEDLQTCASELYKEWFVRFRFPGYQTTQFENGIPVGWEYKKLFEFGYEAESGNRPSGGIDSSLEDGIPSLGAESIDKLGYFDYSNIKYIPKEFFEKMKRGHGKDDDILLYKDGAYIGKVTLFRNEFPFKEYAVNEHVFLLRSNNHNYQNYLYFTLNMPQYFAQMQNLNRNAAQPGLARSDLDIIKLMVPEEKIVIEFNKIINPIINNIFIFSKQITNLTQQRDLLLPRLMSGKIELK